jgi:hypothetical protein
MLLEMACPPVRPAFSLGKISVPSIEDMRWLIVVALALIVIAAAYVLQMRGSDYGFPDREGFLSGGSKTKEDQEDPLQAEGSVEEAAFHQGLPLSDFLETKTGVTTLGAGDCAAADSARQMELGGQYVQRTNNYQREYPDHCSSLLSDFVGGFYKPKYGGVGMTVPCDGLC